MATLSDWRVIAHCTLGVEKSPLLFKSETTTTEYTVYVTDLVRIWTESLKRKDIIRRALELDTSIDPSEGNDQLRLLLRTLRDVLDRQSGTSLLLTEKSNSQITLEATASLPSPLSPLVWPFYLRSAPQDLLSSELVVPCLRDVLHSKIQVSSLLTRLREKDHVIGKLLDRLRLAGIELTTIFPSAQLQRGSKASTDDLVVNIVKGLREFDEKVWRDKLNSSLEPDMNQEDLLRNVFSSEVVDTSRAEVGTPLGKQSYQGAAQLNCPATPQQELSLTHLQREPDSPQIVDEKEGASEHNTQVSFALSVKTSEAEQT